MMAGRDILGSLLFGLGSGLSTYGKGKAEQVALTAEEKAKQRQKKADADMKAEQEQQAGEKAALTKIQMLRSFDPDLADRMESEATKLKLSGMSFSDIADADNVKMFRESMQSQKAQSILDQIGGQGSVDEVQMRTGESEENIIPVMQQQASDQYSGEGPQPLGDKVQKSVDILNAWKADKALNQKRLSIASGELKEDAGATFTQQESWDRYQTFLRGRQTDYEQAQRAYEQELGRYNTAQSRMKKDALYTNPYEEPQPPLRPPELVSYDNDPRTSFLSWAQKQSQMLGEVGGRVRGVNPTGPVDRFGGKSDKRKKKVFGDGSVVYQNADGSWSKE
jgi:hypothetical protein